MSAQLALLLQQQALLFALFAFNNEDNENCGLLQWCMQTVMAGPRVEEDQLVPGFVTDPLE